MGVSPLVTGLLEHAPLVAPSLLACDFGNLQREVERLEQAGARILHLDVMDGRFVPNLSFGLPVVEAVRRITDLPLDVHLMISEPEQYIGRFREAGADLLTIHVEGVEDPAPLLEKIRSLGAAAGITLSPPTPVDRIEPLLDLCDLVLVMSVMPGFGGQSFQTIALRKLARLSERLPARTLLSVDGGINPVTIGACAKAGANLFVVGTALLGHHDYPSRIAELRGLAKSNSDISV